MSAKEKVEGYMINLGLTFEEIDENSWIINDEANGLEQVAVICADPLLIIRVSVMDAPTERKEEFYEKLLTLNAADLVHGAYALENGKVMLVATLVLQTLDMEEFQATLDAIGLALAQHYTVLSAYRKEDKRS
ncbi:MAG: YbjN domain-containing protein [Spirochaetales bacterium]|nr:YbjN domain-containing protein [Spirochaetales bacterium]